MVNELSISLNNSWNETSKMLWEGNVHKGSPTILVNFQHTYRTYPYHLPQKTHTYLFFYLRLKCWWINISSLNNNWFFLWIFSFSFFPWYIGRPIFADIPIYLPCSILSDFAWDTYLPKNWTSFMDIPFLHLRWGPN